MQATKGARRQRHVPMRTCAGCSETRPKRDMVLIVRGISGEVAVDPTGKKSGRGTYLCPQTSCWQTALKKGTLDRALKSALSHEERGALHAFALSLAQKAPLVPEPHTSLAAEGSR